MSTVELVATTESILKYFPGAPPPRPSSKAGVLSARFPVDPENCRTKLGAWLAEHIRTTRFDDDLSILNLTLRATQADTVLRTHLDQLRQQALRNPQDLAAATRKLTEIGTHLNKLAALNDTTMFECVLERFAWPVFGSAAAKDAKTVHEYFDLCAGMIRHLRPTKIATYLGESPPESLMASIQ